MGDLHGGAGLGCVVAVMLILAWIDDIFD